METVETKSRCTFGGIEFVADDIASVRVPDASGKICVHTHIAAIASRPAIECLHDAMRRKVRLPLMVANIGEMRCMLVGFGMGPSDNITLSFVEDYTKNPLSAQSPDELEPWQNSDWTGVVNVTVAPQQMCS